jgi:hypothetical protein
MGLLVTMIQNVLLLERGASKDKIEKKIDDCKIMGLLVTMIQNVLLLERGASKDKIEKKIDDCKIKGVSPLIKF